MKNIYTRFFTLSAFVLSVTACSLNEAPSDGILSDQITLTPLTLTAATAGNYSTALSADFIRNLFYMNELPGDNVSLSGTTSDALFFSYNYGHLPNQANSYEIWQQCNKIIAGANKLIPAIYEKINLMNLVS
jgi:hypothetical protein